MRIEFALPLLSGLVAAISLAALLRWRALPMDIPNQRSLHNRPVPRSGGLAIWAGWGAALLATGATGAWLLPALVLAVLSLVDDRTNLSVSVRLPVHALAAAWFVWTGLPSMGALPALALVLAIIWMLNLFNFMDGADGLAGAMALSGFSFLAIAALQAGEWGFALQLASLATACLAFLWVNWSPAKVFLGDVGSIPLGFLAAALGSEGWARGIWGGWFPVLVFLPFIADASITLVKRAVRQERFWEAHREHAYQKLVQLGWSHGRVAGLYGAIMAACGLSALVLAGQGPTQGISGLAVWSLLHGIAYAWVMQHFARRRVDSHAQ
ncbi:MAG: glycosyltransferase family 4 protein [Betaproteobacteria bacterium]|nr:glycosyltransferase family 4 protein [Betaproteobacteria bacterium]